MKRIYQQGEHSPCEHFAAVAYESIVAAIPTNDYKDVASPFPTDEAEDEQPGSQRRWLDLAVLRSLRGDTVTNRKKINPKEGERSERPLELAGHRIDWHLALPELKIWAGQATLQTLVDGRRVAVQGAVASLGGTSIRDWRLPYPSMSGLDPRTAAGSLDIGFSPATLGMMISTYIADELLAVVGMQISPVIRFGRKSYGYADPSGQWWQFSVIERESYHRMLTMSQRHTNR